MCSVAEVASFLFAPLLPLLPAILTPPSGTEDTMPGNEGGGPWSAVEVKEG